MVDCTYRLFITYVQMGRIELRVDDELEKMLDGKRGEMSRSEFIRMLVKKHEWAESSEELREDLVKVKKGNLKATDTGLLGGLPKKSVNRPKSLEEEMLGL